MSFTKLLSTKQESAIGLFVIGLILFLNRTSKEAGTLLAIVGMIMVLGSINEFISDFIRKKKITNRFQKNYYDSPGEKRIADYFKRKNVAYVHHPTIKVERFWWKISIPFGSIKIEPDFYLPEFNVYAEY